MKKRSATKHKTVGFKGKLDLKINKKIQDNQNDLNNNNNNQQSSNLKEFSKKIPKISFKDDKENPQRSNDSETIKFDDNKSNNNIDNINNENNNNNNNNNKEENNPSEAKNFTRKKFSRSKTIQVKNNNDKFKSDFNPDLIRDNIPDPGNKSIKVFVRFRPFNDVENDLLSNNVGWEVPIYNIEQKIVTIDTHKPGKEKGPMFKLDDIFKSDTPQLTVYEVVGKNIVKDIMQGYNGTIFAYGQSGSGKTFTMYGRDVSNEETKGIIPRIIEEIFNYVENSDDNVQFEFKLSLMEIYKEVIYDLLTGDKNLPIKEHPTRGIYVEGLNEVYLSSVDDFYNYFEIAEANRKVGETKLNRTSSRSHSILVLEVTQTFKKENLIKKGILNLVDLAGSEKISKTGAVGETLEEAKKINLSLSALGNVIHALTSGGTEHVPYRDSKLTRILQESLGGNYKTSLIVTCSPHSYHLDETLSTLGFATRAKTIKNKVKVNIKYSYEELQQMVNRLKKKLEIANLKIQKLERGEKIESDNYEDIKKEIFCTNCEVLKDENKILEEKISNLMNEINEKDDKIHELENKIEELKNKSLNNSSDNENENIQNNKINELYNEIKTQLENIKNEHLKLKENSDINYLKTNFLEKSENFNKLINDSLNEINKLNYFNETNLLTKELFEKCYNDSKYDEIYLKYSDNMKLIFDEITDNKINKNEQLPLMTSNFFYSYIQNYFNFQLLNQNNEKLNLDNNTLLNINNLLFDIINKILLTNYNISNDNRLTTNALSLLSNNNIFNNKNDNNKNKFRARVSVIVAGGETSKLKKVVSKRNSSLIKTINDRRRSSIRLLTQIKIGNESSPNRKSLYNKNNTNDRPNSFDNVKVIEEENKRVSSFSPNKKKEKKEDEKINEKKEDEKINEKKDEINNEEKKDENEKKEDENNEIKAEIISNSSSSKSDNNDEEENKEIIISNLAAKNNNENNIFNKLTEDIQNEEKLIKQIQNNLVYNIKQSEDTNKNIKKISNDFENVLDLNKNQLKNFIINYFRNKLIVDNLKIEQNDFLIEKIKNVDNNNKNINLEENKKLKNNHKNNNLNKENNDDNNDNNNNKNDDKKINNNNKNKNVNKDNKNNKKNIKNKEKNNNIDENKEKNNKNNNENSKKNEVHIKNIIINNDNNNINNKDNKRHSLKEDKNNNKLKNMKKKNKISINKNDEDDDNFTKNTIIKNEIIDNTTQLNNAIDDLKLKNINNNINNNNNELNLNNNNLDNNNINKIGPPQFSSRKISTETPQINMKLLNSDDNLSLYEKYSVISEISKNGKNVPSSSKPIKLNVHNSKHHKILKNIYSNEDINNNILKENNYTYNNRRYNKNYLKTCHQQSLDFFKTMSCTNSIENINKYLNNNNFSNTNRNRSNYNLKDITIEEYMKKYLEIGTATRRFDGIKVKCQKGDVKCEISAGLNAHNKINTNPLGKMHLKSLKGDECSSIDDEMH